MPAARTRLACSLFAVPVALVSLTASAAPWNPVDQAVFNDAGQYWSRDVELVDLDNDGFVDILFANVGGVFEGTDDAEMPNQAFHNDAGAAFSDISMDVFGGDPEGLWRRVLRRQRGPLSSLALYPDDLMAN